MKYQQKKEIIQFTTGKMGKYELLLTNNCDILVQVIKKYTLFITYTTDIVTTNMFKNLRLYPLNVTKKVK